MEVRSFLNVKAAGPASEESRNSSWCWPGKKGKERIQAGEQENGDSFEVTLFLILSLIQLQKGKSWLMPVLCYWVTLLLKLLTIWLCYDRMQSAQFWAHDLLKLLFQCRGRADPGYNNSRLSSPKKVITMRVAKKSRSYCLGRVIESKWYAKKNAILAEITIAVCEVRIP